MEFFEKIGDKISTNGRKVTKKAKELTDVARLNSKINEQEQELKNVYIEIGKAYYEATKQEPSPEFLPLFQSVISIQGAIAGAKEEIAQIKGIRNCINCNAEMANSAVFCPSCGTKNEVIETISEVVDQDESTCPGCNQPIGDESVFCANCGTKVR